MRIDRLCCLLAVMPLLLAGASAFAEESRWEKTIQVFERQDAENPPPKGEIVFIGSSSIRMWKTDEDFPDFTIISIEKKFFAVNLRARRDPDGQQTCGFYSRGRIR